MSNVWMRILPSSTPFLASSVVRQSGWFILLVVGMLTHPLQAQIVVVRAIDERTQEPAPSAIISLIDQSGRTADRTLTDLLGRGILHAPAEGVYQIQGDRIGFTSTISEPMRLQVRSDTITIRLILGVEQVRLPDLIARGSQVACGIDGVAGSTLAEAWVEAKKALTTAALTTDLVRPLLELRMFERERDLRDRVTSDRTLRVSRTNGSPFVTVNPDVLWQEGFAKPDGDRVLYYAPDANLLLMDEFLEFHCFRLVFDRRDHRGELGLGFEPLPDREVAEIEGTLWLDLKSGDLRKIEFTYVNLDEKWPDDAEAGGMVSFNRVPGVGWIVDNWFIRTPRLSRMVPQDRGFRDPGSIDLVGFFETGGEVQIVAQPKGPSVIAGSVWDSLAGAPLPNVRVALSGGDPSTMTDSLGHFRLEMLSEGQVALSMTHERFALFGIRAPESISIARDLTATVEMAIPSLPVLLERFCAGPFAADTSVGALLGLVVDATGQVRPDVSVDIRWATARVAQEERAPTISASDRRIETATDDEGRFRVCGIPLGATVTLQVGEGNPVGTFTMEQRLVPVVQHLANS